jgi:hypothetical protein
VGCSIPSTSYLPYQRIDTHLIASTTGRACDANGPYEPLRTLSLMPAHAGILSDARKPTSAQALYKCLHNHIFEGLHANVFWPTRRCCLLATRGTAHGLITTNPGRSVNLRLVAVVVDTISSAVFTGASKESTAVVMAPQYSLRTILYVRGLHRTRPWHCLRIARCISLLLQSQKYSGMPPALLMNTITFEGHGLP